MAIQFITSNQVVEVNGENYAYPNYPNGISKSIPCRSQVIAAFWKIPVTLGNRLIGYNVLVATDATKPQPDAFKILRLKDALDANTEYGIAVTDADCVTANSWVDKCNGCCGDTPVMATVTIPSPILQSPPQTALDGVNTFIFPFPANPNALLYSIPFPWFNGTAPSPAYAPTGITTAALFVTWANTNWGEFGTWSSTGDVVKLISDDADTIFVLLSGMQVSLTNKAWCFDFTAFSTNAAVNGVKFGTATTIPIAPFMLTDDNRATVIQRLQPLMPGAVFTTAVAHKLGVATVQATPKLYNGVTLVSTATAGACA